MTTVEFHTGIADPAAFACRLLRKAHRLGSRVQLTAPEPLLAEIDRALWVQDERDFVPHVRVPGPAARVLQRTPLWLSEQPPSAPDVESPTVLVNVGAALGDAALRYVRVIEVVSAEPDAAQSGRSRWKFYRGLGLDVVHRTPG